jgi:hypothetical protein
MARDGGCIVPLVDPVADVCKTRDGRVLTGRGRLTGYLEWAHVPEANDNALGDRAPSDRRHGVALCQHHHHNGWENARGRELERKHLASHYPELAGLPDRPTRAQLEADHHARHVKVVRFDPGCYVCVPTTAAEAGVEELTLLIPLADIDAVAAVLPTPEPERSPATEAMLAELRAQAAEADKA